MVKDKEELIILPAAAFSTAEILWMSNRAVDHWWILPDLDQPPFNQPLKPDRSPKAAKRGKPQ